MASNLDPVYNDIRLEWDTFFNVGGTSGTGLVTGHTNGSLFGMAVHGGDLCQYNEINHDQVGILRKICFTYSDNPYNNPTDGSYVEVQIGSDVITTVNNLDAVLSSRPGFSNPFMTRTITTPGSSVVYNLQTTTAQQNSSLFLDVSCLPNTNVNIITPAVNPNTGMIQSLEYEIVFNSNPREGDCIIVNGFPYKYISQHVIDGIPEVRQEGTIFVHETKTPDIDAGVPNTERFNRSGISSSSHILRDFVSTPTPSLTMTNNNALQAGMFRYYARFAWLQDYAGNRVTQVFPNYYSNTSQTINVDEHFIFNSTFPKEGDPDMREFSDRHPNEQHKFLFFDNGAKGVRDICKFQHQRLYVNLFATLGRIVRFSVNGGSYQNSTNISLPSGFTPVPGVYALDIMPDIIEHTVPGDTIAFKISIGQFFDITFPIEFTVIDEGSCCMYDEVLFLNPWGAYQSYLVQSMTQETSSITTDAGLALAKCWDVNEILDYGSEDVLGFNVNTRRIYTNPEDIEFLNTVISSSSAYRIIDEELFEISYSGGTLTFPCAKSSFRSSLPYVFKDSDSVSSLNLRDETSSGPLVTYQQCTYLWPDAVSVFHFGDGFDYYHITIQSAIINGVELIPNSSHWIEQLYVDYGGVPVTFGPRYNCTGGPDGWTTLTNQFNLIPTTLLTFVDACYTNALEFYNTSLGVEYVTGTTFEIAMSVVTIDTNNHLSGRDVRLYNDNITVGGVPTGGIRC